MLCFTALVLGLASIGVSPDSLPGAKIKGGVRQMRGLFSPEAFDSLHKIIFGLGLCILTALAIVRVCVDEIRRIRRKK